MNKEVKNRTLFLKKLPNGEVRKKYSEMNTKINYLSTRYERKCNRDAYKCRVSKIKKMSEEESQMRFYKTIEEIFYCYKRNGANDKTSELVTHEVLHVVANNVCNRNFKGIQYNGTFKILRSTKKDQKKRGFYNYKKQEIAVFNFNIVDMAIACSLGSEIEIGDVATCMSTLFHELTHHYQHLLDNSFLSERYISSEESKEGYFNQACEKHARDNADKIVGNIKSYKDLMYYLDGVTEVLQQM